VNVDHIAAVRRGLKDQAEIALKDHRETSSCPGLSPTFSSRCRTGARPTGRRLHVSLPVPGPGFGCISSPRRFTPLLCISPLPLEAGGRAPDLPHRKPKRP
jgi:hypothetical protein